MIALNPQNRQQYKDTNNLIMEWKGIAELQNEADEELLDKKLLNKVLEIMPDTLKAMAKSGMKQEDFVKKYCTVSHTTFKRYKRVHKNWNDLKSKNPKSITHALRMLEPDGDLTPKEKAQERRNKMIKESGLIEKLEALQRRVDQLEQDNKQLQETLGNVIQVNEALEVTIECLEKELKHWKGEEDKPF